MSRHVVRRIALLLALLVTALGLPTVVGQTASAAPKPSRVTPGTNPDLASGCGLDVVLVLDESASIGGAAGNVRTAARTFLRAFADTNTRAGIVTFSSSATLDVPLTTVTSATTGTNGVHEKAVDDYSPSGYTNWHDALLKAKNAFTSASPARTVPKLVVFVTDGAPNRTNQSGGGTNNWDEAEAGAVDPAVTEMNAMKTSGVHSLVVGVGDAFKDTSPSNARIDALYRVSQHPTPKISPTTPFDPATTDLLLQTNFGDLEADLRKVANQICDGTLTINKYISNANDPSSYSKAGAGWDFTATVNPEGGWILPSTGAGASRSTPTDANSVAQFQWNPGTANWTKSAVVTDVSKTDYTPDRVTCKVNGTAITAPTLNGKNFTVAVGSGKKVECDVYNKYTGKLNTDVAISKSVSASPVVVNDSVTWTLKATNNGPNTATNVVYTDTLPAGLGAVTNVSAPAGTTFANGVWTIASLSVGAANAKVLTFRTTVDTVGDHLNTVKLTSLDQKDTSTSNNDAQANVVGQKSDVTVSKTRNVANQVVNGNVVWTIVAKNLGDATAQNVRVEDKLPPGLTWVSDSATVGSYDEIAGVWTIGSLAKNATATLTITTKGTTAGTKTNTAKVTTTTPQSNLDNDTAEASVTFTTAELVISKTPSAPTVVLNDTVVWTITVSNTGTATAEGVDVIDALPPGLELVSTSPANALTGNTWNAGSIAPGGSKTLKLTTKVNTLTPVTNKACVRTDTYESNPDDNCDSNTVTATAADVSITKVPDLTQVFINGTVVWNITVANNGAADAQSVVVRELEHDGLTLGAHTASQGIYNPTTKVWSVGTVNGTVSSPPAGGTATLQLTSTVGNMLGALTNVVDVSTSTPETTKDNNRAEGTTTVVAADLTIKKVADERDVRLGDTVTWTITASNLGTATARGVEVEDAFPTGLQVTGVTPAGALSGNVWTIGDLAPGASATLVVTTKTLETGTITNSATVESTLLTPETDYSNNEAHDTVDVTVANVAVTKTVDVKDPSLDGTVVWTVRVANTGSADATGVVVSDLLPGGLGLISAVPSAGTYISSTGKWTVGTLVKTNGSATLTLTTKVTKVGAITNTACFETPTPNLNTVLCDLETVTGHAPELAILKTVSTPNANYQDSVTWSIQVSNTGDATAKTVVVADLLPPGLSLTGSSATVGSFDSGSWTIGDLAAGTSATLTLTTTVTKTGAIKNTACADTASAQVGNPGPVCDDATVTVRAPKLTITKTADNLTPAYQGTVVWTVTVKNTGDATATDVVVDDAAVDGLSITNSAATVGSFTNGVWTIGALAKDATATLTLTSTVTKLGAVTNTACVTTGSAQVSTAAVCADDTVTVTAPNLSVTKKANAETAVNGDTVSWTIVARNTGDREASDVVVTDTNPGGGLTVTGGTATQGSFNAQTGVWTIGTLAKNGGIATLTVTTSVNRTGTVTNKACITTHDAQVAAGPRCDDDTVTGTAADVTVSKRADKPVVVLGDTVTWTIQATNNGSANAENVVVDDTLPVGAVVVSTVPAGALVNGKWAVGTLAKNGGNATLTVTTTMSKTGVATNQVVVSTDTPETNPNNNEASADTKVTAPNLAITKYADLHQQYLGGDVVWTIDVTNNGDADAQGVVVTDAVPDGLQVLSTEPANALVGNAWNVGTLAKGETRTLKLTTRTVATGDLTNQACVITTTEQVDTPEGGRCDEDTTTVTRDAKLEIAKTQNASTPNPRQPGSDVVYDIVVSSTGKSPANDVHFTDVLPAGLVFKSAVGEGWVCTDDAQNVDCAFGGDLAAGTSAPVVTITVTVDPVELLRSEPVTNVACITPASNQLPERGDFVRKALVEDGTGQCSSAETTFPKGELTVSKTNTPDGGTTAKVGDTITYSLTVTATGDLDHTDVVVYDDVPGHGENADSAMTTYVDDSARCVEPPAATPANCSVSELESNGAVTALGWELGDLAHGQSRTVTFQVRIDEPTGTEALEGTVTNVGFGGSDQNPDGVPSNEVTNPFEVAEVLGVKLPAEPAAPAAPGVLAFTGTDLVRQLGLALSLLLVGAFVLRLTRRREEAAVDGTARD